MNILKAVSNHLIDSIYIIMTHYLAISFEHWFTRGELVNTGKTFLEESKL